MPIEYQKNKIKFNKGLKLLSEVNDVDKRDIKQICDINFKKFIQHISFKFKDSGKLKRKDLTEVWLKENDYKAYANEIQEYILQNTPMINKHNINLPKY